MMSQANPHAVRCCQTSLSPTLYYKLVKACFDSKDLDAGGENDCFADFLGSCHHFLATFSYSMSRTFRRLFESIRVRGGDATTV